LCGGAAAGVTVAVAVIVHDQQRVAHVRGRLGYVVVGHGPQELRLDPALHTTDYIVG